MLVPHFEIVNIPVYAVSYIEYGEPGEDLIGHPDEMKVIDAWIEKVKDWAPEGFHFSHFDYGEDDASFCSMPAFGLPCDCIEAKAVYFRSVEK